MAWTLEYDSAEQSFAEWGLSEDLRRERRSLAVDVVTVNAPGPMDGTGLFDYGEEVIIRRDRVLNGGWSGGSIYFRGKATLPQRSGSGLAEGVQYRFHGAWWDLERLVFQQEWKEFTGYLTPGDPDTEPQFVTKRTSELMLGQTLAGAKQHTGAQITEAVNWAITCGVAVQLGTIDAAADIPIYNVRDVTVAEVILQMLRWTPDIIAWFDYSTSPPTFHARKLSNLSGVTVAWDDGNLSELALVARYDLQLPAVCLRFRTVNSVDGRNWLQIVNQNYPAEATGQELGASVNTIELQGSSQTSVYGALECEACDAQAVANADRVAWWQRKEPLFTSLKVDTRLSPEKITITSAVIKDENGDAVDLGTYPNELLDGQVAEWMRVSGSVIQVVQATVTALATYDLYREEEGWLEANATEFLIEKGRQKEISCRIKLTNGVTGNYSVLSEFTSAEPTPVGLAQAVYEAHAGLQYEGELTLVESEVPAGLGMGCKVTVNTGGAQYENLLVQGTTEDLGAGLLRVQVGPARQVGLADLVELLRVNRYRVVWNNPATRSSGRSGPGGNVGLGARTARENTTTGLGSKLKQVVDAASGDDRSLVVSDAENKKLVLKVVDSAGAAVTGEGSITCALGDTLGSDGNKHEVKLREVCVDVSGVEKTMLVLGSEPYDVP